ncbi:hypothetical protein BDQ17DRAFT_1432113 [Cyathus striatus]|nr:hypothetical protein BDQ17DRAFT_1432113 [Cyathus striatus]
MSTIQTLVSIISNNTKVIEDTYASNNLPVPSLDGLSPPSALDGDPKLIEAKQLVVAAAAQLIGTIRSPAETVMNYAGGMFTTAALEHGDKISAKNGVDASYLSRVLRYLATRHVFKEVTPDVFANNAISSLLMKDKTLEEIASDPIGKFDGSPLAAGDDMLKSTAYLSNFLQNPGNNGTPFNMALGTDLKMWDWYQETETSRDLDASQRQWLEAPSDSPHTFDKLALKPNDVVVDVGGSIGTLVVILKNAYPELQYVVQDLQRQITDAEKFWGEKDPAAISSGKVKLQVRDFFTPQPIKKAAVYVLRVVIHDWPMQKLLKLCLCCDLRLEMTRKSSSLITLLDTL